MELRRDLLKIEKRSVFRIILGFFFLVISILWLVDKESNEQIIRLIDWMFFGTFILNGIVHTVEGFGFSLARIFGKAFILIDTERIAIKTSVLAKEQNIFWKDIRSVSNKPVRCRITRNDGTLQTLNLSKFDYQLVKDIKGAIEQIASEKGVEFQ